MAKPKISWNMAHMMVAYCKEHNVNYSNETTIPNTFASGLKKNVRTPNNMVYHLPNLNKSYSNHTELHRAYLFWYGEELERVIESLAFLKMTTNRELWLLRCKTPPSPMGAGGPIYVKEFTG